MAKLGYTWYPKDWGNSEKVFELDLSERGLYRELIDMAMLNDNRIEINLNVWMRKFGSDVIILQLILDKLEKLKLVEIENDILFIPSCESRLNLVRGGRNGGKKSKPNAKPFKSLDKKNQKPISKQREKEIETKIEIESKLKEIKIEDIISYFTENGYSEIAAKKFFDYYSVANWKDAKGNKVKNWKQKAQAVWFKDENKIKVGNHPMAFIGGRDANGFAM